MGDHSRPGWFDAGHDAHGHPYACANERTDGTPCGARMRATAVGDYWEICPAPGETRFEEITWVSPSWSRPADRARLEESRRSAGEPPLPPGPVADWDIPGFAGANACGWRPTTRPHRWACPDPGAPVLVAREVPECCGMPMRLAPRGWACRRDRGHVGLFEPVG